jgi:demethylmenaquinone methyltransferase/2-methoxy-6-polyprenyl-1,4-benzoquinol methylase
MGVPEAVRSATENARRHDFALSCDERVGALLAVLAAGVRADGAILELGTGAGVGLAWIVSGLGGRSDVRVVSVELEPATAAVAAMVEWPAFVTLRVADALDVLGAGQRWDLIFADAQGGKWEGLDDTIAALTPGGTLLVDDMTPTEFLSDVHRAKTGEVRSRLLASDRLACVEMAWATGLILCTRRHDRP